MDIAECTHYANPSYTNHAALETLNCLLAQNHSFAVLRHPRLLFHNHMPHALGSSYLLGASSQQLQEIFAHEVPDLLPVDDESFVHCQITAQDWRQFLGRKEYSVAYTQFFDAELERSNGDWKDVVQSYLFSGAEPLANGLSGGLAHPFIHLAYAFELDSPAVASEALSMACTEYDATHRYLDVYPPDTATYKTRRLGDVLERIRSDKRLDGSFQQPGFANIPAIVDEYEHVILEHWNSWVVDDPLGQLHECLRTSCAVATSTNGLAGYDFYLAHILTVCHALHVLLPVLPGEQHARILRQYGLWSMIVYTAQLRPTIDTTRIESYEPAPLGWTEVIRRALQHPEAVDAHFPKVVRALWLAGSIHGSEDGLYLQAATRFVAEFRGWTGFGLGADAVP